MAELDGEWNVRRVSGLLPPLYGVRKRIAGARGVTALVERELRYRGVFSGLVDAVEPAGDGWRGVARYRGRRLGRFAMTRVTSARG